MIDIQEYQCKQGDRLFHIEVSMHVILDKNSDPLYDLYYPIDQFTHMFDKLPGECHDSVEEIPMELAK